MSVEGVNVKHLIRSWFCGLGDALKVHNSLVFFLTSDTVRRRALQCLMLNGFIFLGSIFLVQIVIAPLWRLLIYVEPPADAEAAAQLKQVADAFDLVFVWMYQILWLYPIYCISFILSAIWYQDIADWTYNTFRGRERKPLDTSFQRWLLSMAEEVYRLLLIGSFLVQLTLCSFIPYVGHYLGSLHLCWLYSLYCFEYRWAIEGWTLDGKLEYFEKRWAYFAGFGFPAAFLTIAFPKFINSGVYAFCFPVFLILATVADPGQCDPPRVEAGDGPTDGTGAGVAAATNEGRFDRLPIFRFAKVLNSALLRVVQTRVRRSLNGSSSSAGTRGRRSPSTAGSSLSAMTDSASGKQPQQTPQRRSPSPSASASAAAKAASAGSAASAASTTLPSALASSAPSSNGTAGAAGAGPAVRPQKRASVSFATTAQSQVIRQQSQHAIQEALSSHGDD